MKFNRRQLLGGALVSSAGLVSAPAFAAARTSAMPDLLPQALAALDSHSSAGLRRDRIGIVDFSLHSGIERFHMVDVAAGKIMDTYLVAHGRGSDPAHSGYVQKFSNRPGSNASSRGAYMTGQTYYGKHGRSRRLHGLDAENSEAFDRAIVIHGANYVDRGLLRRQGRIGRSLGCFAVTQKAIGPVLDQLGDNRLLYVAKHA